MASLQSCFLLSFTFTVVRGTMASCLVCLSPDQGPSSSLGMISGWDIMLCTWARHLTLTVPLNLATAVWTGIPSRGSRSTPSRFMLKEPDLGHLAHMQSLPSPGWVWKVLPGSRI